MEPQAKIKPMLPIGNLNDEHVNINITYTPRDPDGLITVFNYQSKGIKQVHKFASLSDSIAWIQTQFKDLANRYDFSSMREPDEQFGLRRDDWIGVEFDWFAVDRNMQIGYFCSAGYGSIPKAVMSRVWDIDVMVRTLLDQDPEMIGEQEKIDNWQLMASKGFFTFDWQHWNGPYRLQTKPSEPIVVDSLSEDQRKLCRLALFTEIDFQHVSELDPQDYFDC